VAGARSTSTAKGAVGEHDDCVNEAAEAFSRRSRQVQWGCTRTHLRTMM
jgi:hypothetical protein